MTTRPKSKNPYHGNTEYTELTPSGWVECWTDGRTGFRKTVPQRLLVKNVDTLINGRQQISVFFPFCGDSLDMKYLYDAGHSIIGIDIADQALKDFFTQHKIEYTLKKVEKIKGHVYMSTDGRVKLYCCNLYDFSSEIESGMQGLYDRGGLSAVNFSDRERYVQLLVSLMAKDCRYFLLVCNYEQDKYSGPPHAVDPDCVHQLFGEKCDITKVESADGLGVRQKEWGLDWFEESLYLLTLKFKVLDV